MKYYILGFRKYWDFTGRASRSEFGYFFLWHWVVVLCWGVTGLLSGIGDLSGVYVLLSIIPLLAVTSRRAHDLGYSTWTILLLFVPFANVVYLVCLPFVKGTREGNRYGDPPDEVLLRRWFDSDLANQLLTLMLLWLLGIVSFGAIRIVQMFGY